MEFRRFIKEEGIYILVSISVFFIVNIYLLTLNSFKNNVYDLIYIDLIILAMYISGYYISYKKWKKRYVELNTYVLENKDINSEDIINNLIAEEIMSYIIEKKESNYKKDISYYEDKLKDLEEYISKWVHEIKLPITVLNIISERIEDDNMSINIKNEVEKINFLVNSVMYGSRATVASEDIFIAEEGLDNIVKQSIKNNAFFLIKDNIDVKMENLNYKIYTDKKWLVYVIDQITNNAIKYSRAQGKIEFYSEENDKSITLVIKDNGIGIAKEDVERIFNKGFTGSNGRNQVYKSTGMGLFFSKKILNKLNHNIMVQSVENQCTEVRIEFYKISDYLKVTKM